jgi:Protein of unknown function (DUF3102)
MTKMGLMVSATLTLGIDPSERALADEINAGHAECAQCYLEGKQAYCRGLERAIKTGHALIKAKKLYGQHGRWMKWLKDHCPDLPQRTADRYMQQARDEKWGREWIQKAQEFNLANVANLTMFAFSQEITIRANIARRNKRAERKAQQRLDRRKKARDFVSEAHEAKQDQLIADVKALIRRMDRYRQNELLFWLLFAIYKTRTIRLGDGAILARNSDDGEVFEVEPESDPRESDDWTVLGLNPAT